MQKLSITGKVISVSDLRTIGDKGTQICTVKMDLTENPQYPNTPEFQAIGKVSGIVQKLRTGDSVILGVVVEGRDYTNKEGNRSVITNLNIIDVSRMNITAITEDEPAKPATVEAPVDPFANVPETAEIY